MGHGASYRARHRPSAANRMFEDRTIVDRYYIETRSITLNRHLRLIEVTRRSIALSFTLGPLLQCLGRLHSANNNWRL